MERDYVLDLLSRGTRMDGRGFMEYREITIDAGPMLKADGSARVNLGDTQVTVGVKYEVGTPYPDAPDQGIITCMAEFIPFASPMFESGPPREDAIELARVVDRGIRHSEIVDKKKLCITPHEEVFLLFTDIYYTQHNGNPWDCASLAAICALKSVMLPDLKKEDRGGQMFLVPQGNEWSLDIQDYPVTITFVKIDKYIIVDPNLMEELICDARISYCIDKEGRITSIQKNGSGTFSKEELVDTAKKARDIAPKLQDMVKNFDRDLSNM